MKRKSKIKLFLIATLLFSSIAMTSTFARIYYNGEVIYETWDYSHGMGYEYSDGYSTVSKNNLTSLTGGGSYAVIGHLYNKSKGSIYGNNYTFQEGVPRTWTHDVLKADDRYELCLINYSDIAESHALASGYWDLNYDYTP